MGKYLALLRKIDVSSKPGRVSPQRSPAQAASRQPPPHLAIIEDATDPAEAALRLLTRLKAYRSAVRHLKAHSHAVAAGSLDYIEC